MNFGELYQSVERFVHAPGASKRDWVKDAVNMVYFEMLHADDIRPMFWLRKLDDSIKLVGPTTITNITAASPPVVTAPSHGLNTDDCVSIYDVDGMTEVNNRMYRITRISADIFSLQSVDGTDIVGASWTAYTSGGEVQHRGLKISSMVKPLQFNLVDPDSFSVYDDLEFVMPDEFRFQWDQNDARPIKLMHLKELETDGTEQDFLVWGPGSDDNYDSKLWYERSVSAMSSDTDVPMMPSQFHYGIVAGSVMRLAESNVQVEAAVVWPAIYQGIIRQLLEYNEQLYRKAEGRPKPFLL